MLTVAAPVVPAAHQKEAKPSKKRDSTGLKMITSYNLFCEQRRPEVRQANPNIVPRCAWAFTAAIGSHKQPVASPNTWLIAREERAS